MTKRRAQTTIEAIYAERKRPLVFGHRGASATAPMNTLAAFERAADMGADGVELDVWLSFDGVPVIIHDQTVDGTTDGSGQISLMNVSELKELDAGSWFSPGYAGQRIPTLAEVFEAVGQRLIINVEIKSVGFQPDAVVKATVDVIRQHNMAGRVVVSSFSPFVLRRVRKVAPELAIGFLHAPGVPFYLSWFLTGTPVEARHPHFTQVDERYLRRARQNGWRVNTWTVNDPFVARQLADLGVDAIITDKPDEMLAALAEA